MRPHGCSYRTSKRPRTAHTIAEILRFPPEAVGLFFPLSPACHETSALRNRGHELEAVAFVFNGTDSIDLHTLRKGYAAGPGKCSTVTNLGE